MTSSPHHLFALAACLTVACADVELDTVKDPGSTVPVPDMTGPVRFAEDGLTGSVLVSGTSGAVTPSADVLVENRTTSVIDRTTATELGEFSVVLTDAEIGDTVWLTAEVDGETSDAVDLPLVYDGVPPQPPLELHAFHRLEEPGTAEASGAFLSAAALVVRVVNNTTGVVVEGASLPSAEHRTFEIIIQAALEDEILVNGTDPEHEGAPGLFGRTEVIPR